MHKLAKYSRNNNDKRVLSADAVPLSSALRPRLLRFVKGDRIVRKIQQNPINRTIFHQNHPKSVNSTANFCPKRQKFAVGMVRVAIFVGFVAILGFIGVSNIITTNVSALSLNMTIPKNLSLSVNPNVNNGFGESSSGEISISTDNISGYTLKVNSKNSSNDLVNPLSSNAKLSSITEPLTLDQYKNGSNGKSYVNTWAFKPSHINNEVNTNYVPGPDNTTGITLAKTEEENSTIPATYAVAIASKVDNTIPAGNYSNTFVLTATANELHYTINYDASSLSGATNAGSFTTQTGVITGSTQEINATTPTKNGYEFTGWCSQPLETDGSCKGVIAQPGSYYPMCKCDTDVTLYAMWEEINLGDLGYMQSFSCSTINDIEDYGTVTDSRDGNKYTVAKLKDGKCWMIENLKLQGRKTLTSSDSDVSSSWTLPASINSGFNSDIDPQMHYDSNYGGYYNWAAATAGTNPSSGKASSSICPSGWHLPTGNTDGEFCGLVQAYGGACSNTIQTAVYNAIKEGTIPNFRLSGSYTSNSLDAAGSEGLWWSSTATNTSIAYYLYLLSDGRVDPRNNVNKYYGNSVRCVAG